MSKIARKSDGRRIFTDEFKREQIDRVWSGEMTLSELSRKLGIARSLLQRWKRLMPREAEIASKPRIRLSPARELQGDQYIRELQQLVGKQTVELELLRAELDALKNSRHNGRRFNGASRR
jgi:transposase-like protein